ncbi:hypothetical protein SAMN05421858_2874 [Haladaptatus litoreus]|uniref:Uncharacterized protein n=1 Tax=Haladaptatus litoreus TaxID=553468 RepID=A0A1N7C0B1_9EURY|nr:hypothetical protein [Haladaptatus litoreus]SIR56990.1 hypothetical protein SAMN05421858_2874 [Haladaptatus litoreus]
MQEEIPDRPGVANLIEALNLRRNAIIGFALSALFTTLVYAYRVVFIGEVQGQAGTPVSFLALAVVLALTLGALITAVLTFVSARNLARDLD